MAEVIEGEQLTSTQQEVVFYMQDTRRGQSNMIGDDLEFFFVLFQNSQKTSHCPSLFVS